jgi:hypothetical protein
MRSSLRTGIRVLIGTLFLVIAAGASAQPYNVWLVNPSGHGYVNLPARDYSGGSFTFEAWVAVTDATSCATLAGNNFTQSIWIGVCGTTLRSYVRGSGSAFDGGTVPANDWTHVAVTFDNDTKVVTHYVDGEPVASRVEPGPITASTSNWRIFSDVAWEHSPTGAIDEVRFWSVARTKDQIRSTINQTITGAVAGLVSVYHLDANTVDSAGARNGGNVGTVGFLSAPIGPPGCTTNATTLCVGASGRFAVNVDFISGGVRGTGKVVPVTTPESGLFWFFGANNWEVMVKVLNGCPLNGHFWVFSAATTDQHYELVVTDYQSTQTKRYFNYAGVAAAAVTDTSAFATCPLATWIDPALGQ